MTTSLFRFFLLFLLPAAVWAQLLDKSSLIGDYHFVHLLVSTSPAGEATNARNLGGTITFDGNGGYSFEGQLGSGSGAPAAVAGTGTYTVEANAFVSLSNPSLEELNINARLGAESEAVVGASTEAADGSYDLFVAVRAPSSGAGAGTLSGNYTGGSLWLPGGRDAAIKTALVELTANGQGAFTTASANGHAADAGDAGVEESIGNATYTVNANGTGTADFGTSSSLIAGDYSIFVSANGNYLLGHSMEAGARAILLAVKNLTSAGNASFNNNYWIAELYFDGNIAMYTSAAGALRGNGAGKASISERTLTDTLPLDFAGVNDYAVNANGTGFLGGILATDVTNFAVGAPTLTPAALTDGGVPQAGQIPGAFVGAQIDIAGQVFRAHGIIFGVLMPNLTGEGVFLNPLGVLNAATFAPPTFPISGGTLLSLFGSGLTPRSESANAVPLPTSLAGVSVTVDGVLAPLLTVTKTANFDQINLQVPFATSGQNAAIVVNNNGDLSNEVRVPVAASSPGIFSVTQSGIGSGIITHANFEPVTEQDPAAPGETVVIFLTGLGALNPPAGDGAPGPVDPLSRVTDQNVQVLFNNEAGGCRPQDPPGVPCFVGAAPNFVGLYQINVTIPSAVVGGAAVPVAIGTDNAFADFVDIAIGPEVPTAGAPSSP